MPIIGLLRVRNEARWIDRVVRSITPVCTRVLILDDASDDGTPDICAAITGVTVYRAQESAKNESADKDFLLSKAYEFIPDEHKKGNPDSPWFGLLVDGDEELFEEDREIVRELAKRTDADAFHFRIPYLWNDEQSVRVDGVYSHMANVGRPSMFRLMNDKFRFQRTPFGKDGQNFHCSSVPQEMLHYSRPSPARLKHWGYMHAEDRVRKFHWYNRLDPENWSAEDCYRHMVQGDVPEVPAHWPKWEGPPMNRVPDGYLKHAGPLRIEPLSSCR